MIACAMPGIVFPSLKLTFESNAPVGTKSTLFQLPLRSFGRISALSVEAAQPQPLPPE